MLLGASALACSGAAQAGPYIGASWGAYSIDESNLDDNDDLWKAYAGYTFNDIIGVEGTWVDFSRAGTGSSSFEADGWGLSAVVALPLPIVPTIFAKAGQFWWDSETAVGGLPAGDDGNDPFFGAGIVFGGPLGLRLEWERYDIADIDVDSYSIGIQFGF
jgi:hypothetical protein